MASRSVFSFSPRRNRARNADPSHRIDDATEDRAESGKGKIVWTVFGVLFLSMINASLDLMGLGHDFAVGVKGGVILLAAVIDAARQRVMARQ